MKLKTKLTKRFITIGILSVLLTAISISIGAWMFFGDRSRTDLESYSKVVAENYNSSKSVDELSYFATDRYRVTLIKSDGKVLYESSKSLNSEEMENHSDRPEFIGAMEQGEYFYSRMSDSVSKVTYYNAIKTDDGNVLRVAVDIDSIFAVFMNFIPVVIFVLIYMTAFCIMFASESTKRIVAPIDKMAEDINSIAYDELVPFARTIHNQHDKINEQMHRLQLEKDKINALIDNMNEGFILVDTEGKILMENNSVKKLLGSGDYSAVGQKVIMLTRNGDFIRCVTDAQNGESSTTVIKTGDRHIRVIASPVYSNGEQNGVICLLVDISESVKAEKMRREFTANVSHELKTPLTSISGYAEMIENGMAKEDDVKAFAKKIHKEAGRLVSLIGDIIQLSQLDEPQKDVKSEKIDLLEIANECAEALSENALKKEVDISVTGESTVINGNSAMIYELVYNLCDNAIRYNKQGGKVDVEICQKENEAIISVSDTGIGIPEKYQSRVFERFYRVDKSRSKETGGTGLGLAIVKHIAESHNAEISLKSVENSGTTITVSFALED